MVPTFNCKITSANPISLTTGSWSGLLWIVLTQGSLFFSIFFLGNLPWVSLSLQSHITPVVTPAITGIKYQEGFYVFCITLTHNAATGQQSPWTRMPTSLSSSVAQPLVHCCSPLFKNKSYSKTDPFVLWTTHFTTATRLPILAVYFWHCPRTYYSNFGPQG